jgi:hypothetical protein
MRDEPVDGRMRVLLPHPDGPATSTTSPATTVRETSRIAGWVARRYRKVSPETSTMGSGVDSVIDPGPRCGQACRWRGRSARRRRPG